MFRISRSRLCSRSAGVCGFFAVRVAAFAAPAGASRVHGWQDLLTDKVIACGVAAIALLLLSLLLRGMLKVISLAIVVVLAVGAFWFLREAWGHRAEFLPREWTALADQTLSSPKAQSAWQSVQSELSHASAEARARLSAGTDDARRSLAAKLEAKAAELRKAGSRTEADELLRLREMVAAEK